MKKRVIIIAAALLCALAVVSIEAADRFSHKPAHIICTEDYPAVYAAELKEIFGEYSVGARRDMHIEGEVCSCGYHQDTIDYSSWEISYMDACGGSYICELNNREDFYAQQFEWMEAQVFSHYYNTYALRFFPSAADDAYKGYCRIGDIRHSWSSDEDLRQMETAEAYLQSLIDGKTIVPLGKLDYASLFSDYPAVLYVHVALDDENIAAEQWQANFDEQLARMHEMADSIICDTGSSANLILNLYSRADAAPEGSRERFIHYVNGAPLEERGDFNSKVFAAYEGKFWE